MLPHFAGLLYEARGIVTVTYDSSCCEYEQPDKLKMDGQCCMIVNASTTLHLIVVFKCNKDNRATFCVNPPCYLWNSNCSKTANNIRLQLDDIGSDSDGENASFKPMLM